MPAAPAANPRRGSETPPSNRGKRRWLRWTAGLAAAVVLPKCLLCVAGYLALGTGLMSAAPELCGATEGVALHDGILAAAGLFLAGIAWMLFRIHRSVCPRPPGRLVE